MKIIVILLIASLTLAEPGFSIDDQTKYFGELLGQNLSYLTATGYVKFPEIGSLFFHIVLQDGVANFDAIKQNDVLAIWLNGGPGSSSQLGNYMEIGPWVVQKNTDEATKADKPYIFTKREYSWNKKMHLIFIDQPFGAGMSIEIKKGEVTNSDQAAAYFVQTLDAIYTHQPQLQKCKTYIFGESYGGHYVPAFATKLVQTADTLKLTNFKGVAIVDGITDTLNQLTDFHSYLYNIGAISEVELWELKKIQALGQQAILDGDYVNGTIYLDQTADDKLIERLGNLNVYNIRRYKGQSDYDYSWANFLNDNIKKFTSEKDSFSRGNDDIYEAFTEDQSQSRLQDIVDLLNKKYKVLLLNGQLDYILHTPGALNWIYNMKWNYSIQWKNSQKQFIQLLQPGETNKYETHGYIKTYENFSYGTIYKAGHMIPTDNPQAAYQVITDFIK